MANTTRTQIPDEVNAVYDRSLLRRAVPLFVHTMWAQIRDIPKNAGSNTVKFRRYGNLTAATTALDDGVTPTGSQLSVTDITADVSWYGDFVTLTDQVTITTPDPLVTETAMLFGDQFGDTVDQLTRDVLAAGSSVSYGGDATSRSEVATGDVITLAMVKTAVTTLKGNNARKITSMVSADSGYNTSPIKPAFVAIVHTNITKTIEGFEGFVPVEKYQGRATVLPGEIGYVNDVRFVETTNAKVFTGEGASSIDVYATLILAADAYGTTRISGEAIKNIIKPLGSSGTEDPLDQRGTHGWKATFVAKILNNNFMTRIEHSLT